MLTNDQNAIEGVDGKLRSCVLRSGAEDVDQAEKKSLEGDFKMLH